MVKWEYCKLRRTDKWMKLLHYKTDTEFELSETISKEITKLGLDGWELCIFDKLDTSEDYIFKRVIE